MIEYHENSGVVIDTQRFLGINTPFVGSNRGQGPYWPDNSNEALVASSLFSGFKGKAGGDERLFLV